MAVTAKFGISDSQFNNVEFGLGSSGVPFNKYSGVYTLTANKTNDTLYSNINYPEVETQTVAIPNPYIQTGLVGD